MASQEPSPNARRAGRQTILGLAGLVLLVVAAMLAFGRSGDYNASSKMALDAAPSRHVASPKSAAPSLPPASTSSGQTHDGGVQPQVEQPITFLPLPKEQETGPSLRQQPLRRPQRILEELPRRVLAMWLGSPMTGARLASFESLVSGIGVPVELITQDNLMAYSVPSCPLHPLSLTGALSNNHAVDYFRVYFMHHFGGGYHDVKGQKISWEPHFDKVAADTSIWSYGIHEAGPGDVGCNEDHRIDGVPSCTWVREKWQHLNNNGAYLMRSRTSYTADWLTWTHKRMSEKSATVMAHPAPMDRCCLGVDANGYPIRWAELHGEINGMVQAKYVQHMSQGLPHWDSSAYRGSSESITGGRQKIVFNETVPYKYRSHIALIISLRADIVCMFGHHIATLSVNAQTLQPSRVILSPSKRAASGNCLKDLIKLLRVPVVVARGVWQEDSKEAAHDGGVAAAMAMVNKGESVFVLDADLYLHPRALEAMHWALAKHPDSDVVIFSADERVSGAAGQATSYAREYPSEVWCQDVPLFEDGFGVGWDAGTVSIIDGALVSDTIRPNGRKLPALSQFSVMRSSPTDCFDGQAQWYSSVAGDFLVTLATMARLKLSSVHFGIGASGLTRADPGRDVGAACPCLWPLPPL